MTDTQSAGEKLSVGGLAQLPFSKPVLQTYSRRNRNCIPAPSAQEAGCLTASAPKSDRQAKLDVTKPFFKRCSLQHPKTVPQQPNKRSFTQLHLDVGQANFACITCSVCGLIYAKGEAKDEKVHALFHANCTLGVKFQGWQHERVVKWDGREGRVLLVIPDDPANHLKKVKEICGVVEDHLGLCKGWLLSAPYQVYLYISSSKHVLGCVVAERITSASPVISNSDSCVTSGCSTAVAAPRSCLDSPSMPMSAPPLAKHRRLSSQLPARSAASMMPLSTSSEASACTEGIARRHDRIHADVKLGMHGLEMGIASCPSQQHLSVGSNQSPAVPSGIKHRSRHQQSKHPKMTLLTRWLATGMAESTGVRTAPSRMRSDSPTSAGSIAASKHGDSQVTADTRLEQQCGISSPIPMMPLTDVTNVCDVSTSGASAAMATDHDDPGSSDLAVCTSSQQVLKVKGKALSSAHHDGSMWQQDPDLVECRPSWSEGGMPQVHHDDVACTTDHSAADGSVDVEVAALDILDTASQSLSRLRPEVQTEILMTDRSKAVKAVCGIKVMWVSAQARRQGIATQLLDTARFVLELQAPQHSQHKSAQWTLMFPHPNGVLQSWKP
ncbi:TPA: hypothetical protein ACH3X1_011921 [Trebouxia sp. C0004]